MRGSLQVLHDDRIHTISTLRSRPDGPPMTVRDQVRIVHRQRRGTFTLPTRVLADAAFNAYAEVNPVEHMYPGNWLARWIVRCPTCGGAEDASPEDPVFFCMSCYNAEVGGQYRAVVFPEDIERVERALMARPHAVVRAFLPGEDADEIERQTKVIERVGGADLDWRRSRVKDSVVLLAERVAHAERER